MFKVIIVDDEHNSRAVVKTFGCWDKYDMTVCGFAGDGKQALYMINEFYPDLLIIDMNMPNMDGVELLCAISTFEKPPKVIVLSGHKDFAYAHAALGYGVIDYLLKPLSRDELNASLKKFVAIAESEKVTGNALKSQNNRLNTQLAFYLQHSDKNEILQKTCENAGITQWQLAVVFVNNENALNDIINSDTTDDLFVLKLQWEHTIYALLLNNNGNGNLQLLNNIVDTLKLRYDAKAGSIEFGKNAETLQDGFNASLAELNSKNLLLKTDASFINIDVLAIKDDLQMGRLHTIPEVVESYINNCSKSGLLTVVNVCDFLNKLAKIVEVVWWNNNLESPSPDITAQLNKVKYTFSSETIFSSLREIATTYYNFFNKNSYKFKKDTIQIVKEYIDENIGHKITLQMLADKFFLNKEYLSRSFKTKYSKNVTEYINKRKCEYAKTLLGASTVKDVAELLGFENASYFSKVYKKHMGVSPNSDI